MASAESEDAEEVMESIMCRVLNVVIDHSMEDPTPMEPEEYQKRQKMDKKIKVPVVRIFGPLLRDSSRGPLQSACLYVHGAFPYLLARPVVAGPDGSLKRASPIGGQVNWDDPCSVERIVDSIQMILEDAIQSLDMERRQQQAAEAHKAKDTLPVIRKVTVVQGRGFYTYCPGPVAPFLRVEYYDPKLRWKVKMMLERGLQTPLSFYPDPEQYDRNDEENAEVLRFHCYEAHIPYTMQFFKDWNLAGMAYLHVQQGMIRPPLRETCFAKYRAAPFDKVSDLPAVFLRSNTPDKYLWPTPFAGSHPATETSIQGSDFYHDTEFSPPPKGTIADVEIDCTVRDLRNVDMVLKTLPSDLDERDKIQWRAVPSLQEIWRQERQRMAKLLTPEQDFLTPRHIRPSDGPKPGAPLPFTLNVKQGAERSGGKLAVKGMQSLVKVTSGLEVDFRRSLRQILERHLDAIEQTDRDLRKPQTPPPCFHTPTFVRQRRENPSLTPNIDEAIDALASWACTHVKTPKTPSIGDAVIALESLQDDAVASSVTPRHLDTPSSYGARPDRDAYTEDDLFGFSLVPSQQSRTIVELSYPSSQEMQASSNPLTTADPAVLSQIIDRCDSIFHDASAGREHLEDYIDAETLRPYENLDFGEERCRAQFIIATDPSGTIRICGNLLLGCRREGHDCQDETSRARPGYYKTVTTGTFVDGLLDTSRAEHDDDEEDKDKFEHALSVLATQLPTAYWDNNAPDIPPRYHERYQHSADTYTKIQDDIDATGVGRRLTSDDHSRYTGEIDINADEDDSTSEINSTADVEESFTSAIAPVQSLKVKIPDCFPSWVIPVRRPPCRANLMAKTGVPLSSTTCRTYGTPDWLVHAARYMSSYGELVDASAFGGSYVQSVRLPPSNRKIKTWCKRKRLKSRNAMTKTEKCDIKARRAPIQNIDNNARRVGIVAEETEFPLSKEMTSLAPGQEIEEVSWQSSQPWNLSMTQKSQKDDDEQAKPNAILKANINTDDDEQGATGTQTGNNSQVSDDALEGIGAQGGRIHIQGGGTLKAKTRSSQNLNKDSSDSRKTSGDFFPSPISFMSIEVHVQCRTGVSRLDSKKYPWPLIRAKTGYLQSFMRTALILAVERV